MTEQSSQNYQSNNPYYTIQSDKNNQQPQISMDLRLNQSLPKQINLNNSSKYLDFFRQVEQQATQRINSCNNHHQAWKQHRITMNEDYLLKRIQINGFVKPLIQIVQFCHYGALVSYFVYIYKYRISVCLLHTKNQSSLLKLIGQGGYGQICQIQLPNHQKIISKRTHFINNTAILENTYFDKQWIIYPNKSEIEVVLYQYAFYRLCSFFKIGCCLYSKFGFDIICYQDVIQFFMEQCIPMSNIQNNKFQFKCKLALRILHKLKIIHKDVKNQNIMFSPAYKTLVFIDFGISHEISQQLGELTLTYKQGTPGYMSAQMIIIKNKPKYVDLYYNDMIGLKISIGKNIQKNINKLRMEFCFKNNKKSTIKNNFEVSRLFYQCLYIFGGILNCDEIILLRLQQYQYLLKNNQICQILRNFDLQEIKRPIQMINISESQNSNIIRIIQNNFSRRINKQFRVDSIEFLIRIYGMSRKLLSYTHQFDNFKRKKQFIEKLRDLQVDQNQNKILNFNIKFDKNRQIKSLQRQLKFIGQKLTINYTQHEAIQFCNITILLLAKHKIKESYHFYDYFENLIKQGQNKQKIELLKCLWSIVKSDNQQQYKDIFNKYLINRNFKRSQQEQIQIYRLLKQFYSDLQISSKFKQYSKLLLDISSNSFDFIQIISKKPTHSQIQQKKSNYFQQFYNIYKIAQILKYKKTHFQIILICYYKCLQYLCYFPQSNQYSKLLNQIGLCFKYLKKNNQFQMFCRKAHDIYKGKDFQLKLDIYWNMVECNYLNNNVHIANQYLQKSLHIAIQNYGPQHLSTAIYYASLGYLCLKNNDLQKADQYSKKGLQIVSLQRAQQSYTYIIILETLASVYSYTKKNYNSQKIYQQCLKKKILMFGEYDIEIVKTLNALAISGYTYQHLEMKINNAKKSIDICQKMGYNTKQLAQGYGILVTAYLDRGEFDKMEKALQAELRTVKACFKQNSKFSAYAYTNQGKCYFYKKDYRKALLCYNKAMTIKERQFGENHFDLVHDVIQSGYCYFEQKQYKKSIDYLKRAKRIMDKYFGFKNMRYIQFYTKLSEGYEKVGKYQKSIKILFKIRQLCKEQRNRRYLFGIIERLDECYYLKQRMQVSCIYVIYLYKKYLIKSRGVNLDDREKCIIKMNESWLKLYKIYKDKKYLRKILILQILEFRCIDRVYLRILHQKILNPLNSIFILMKILQKQVKNQKIQLYRQILNTLKYKHHSIYSLLHSISLSQNIKTKNSNKFHLLKNLKKITYLNRIYLFNLKYQTHIRKIIQQTI